jgi:hypothetical protein
MPRYSLRTLLLVMLLAGPLLAWGGRYVERVIEERREADSAVVETEQARAMEAQRRARTCAYIKYPNRRWWDERYQRRHRQLDREPIPRNSSAT